jgi:Holliday junction DNA helicase RuvB
VGLSTLAIAVGEETETVETVAEPYLVREGLLGRTPRGRIALAPAWTHLGFAVPAGAFGQDPLDLFQAGTPDSGPAGFGVDAEGEVDPEWIRNSQ